MFPEFGDIPRTIPQAPPAHFSGQLRIGVDIGGVLVAKIQGRRWAETRTAEELAGCGGLARGAAGWFAECARGIRPETVFIISTVHSTRTRNLSGSYLLAPDGLMPSN